MVSYSYEDITEEAVRILGAFIAKHAEFEVVMSKHGGYEVRVSFPTGDDLQYLEASGGAVYSKHSTSARVSVTEDAKYGLKGTVLRIDTSITTSDLRG